MSARRVEKMDALESHHWVPSHHAGLRLFLRHLPPKKAMKKKVVLYVHGATFPSALSIAYRFDGRSWRDELCDAGFDVWGFDFHGFGFSDPQPEMADPATAGPPIGQWEDASLQIEAAVRYILRHEGAERLSIIAHSWGSAATGRFAGRHPDLVDRLVFFGPISRRGPRRYEKAPAIPAWRLITVKDQLDRFIEDVPPEESQVLLRRHFDEWAEAYLNSDADSQTRNPRSVKTPSGPFQNILNAWHGDLGYDPGLVRAPVAIIRGEWDGLVTDEDARWLFDALSASRFKRDIKISRGTHLMHLEEMRHALYRESICFLMSDDYVGGATVETKDREFGRMPISGETERCS